MPKLVSIVRKAGVEAGINDPEQSAMVVYGPLVKAIARNKKSGDREYTQNL
jgi:hypothetical protein